MRVSAFLSIGTVVFMGCGDGLISGPPLDSSTSGSDGIGEENPVDVTTSDTGPSRDASTNADVAADAGTMDSASPIGSDSGLCDDAGCPSGCLIGGSFFVAGAVNPGNPCQSCDPATSTTAWTAAPANSTWDGGFCCGAGSVATPQGPNDCGRCGHGCLGGSCSTSGTCQPFVVATLPGTVTQTYNLAVNGTSAFVSGTSSDEDASVIYSVSLDGGTPQVFARSFDPPYQLFAAPSTLYWAGNQTVASDPVTGGGVTTLAAPDASVVGFGADPSGTFVYWGQLSPENDLSVWMDQVDAAASAPIWDGGNQPCAGVDFSVTASNVYWSYTSNASGSTVPVLTAGLGSAAVTTSVTVQGPVRLAAQGGTLFVLSSNAGVVTVQSLPLADGGAPVVYPDDAGPVSFAVDPNWLYVSDWSGDGGMLTARSLDGGATVVLDDQPGFAGASPTPIVATATGIYWLSPGPPVAIVGIAKP